MSRSPTRLPTAMTEAEAAVSADYWNHQDGYAED